MVVAVRDVVCDYGVFINDELKLILNSKQYALRIAELISMDDYEHHILQHHLYDLDKRILKGIK